MYTYSVYTHIATDKVSPIVSSISVNSHRDEIQMSLHVFTISKVSTKVRKTILLHQWE